MKIIYTKKGEEIFVDDSDYEEMNKHLWYCDKKGYATRAGKAFENKRRTTVSMHREIMDAPEGMVVDHINHETLDNQRKNLRVCSSADNMKNIRSKQGTVLGVRWREFSQRWIANIKIDGQLIHLGTFIEFDEALAARKEAEIKYFGDFRDNLVIYDTQMIAENMSKKGNWDKKRPRKASNNSSGTTGVSWLENRKQWRARITIDYKVYYLGDFVNINDAIKARKEAEEELSKKLEQEGETAC